MEYEDIFTYIGHMDIYQLWLYILTGLLSVFPGYQSVAMNFLGYNPKHWCKVDRLQNFSHRQQRYIAIPMKGSEFDSCRVYDLDYSRYTDEELINWNRSFLQNVTTKECNAWVYDQSQFVATATTEFNLVCGRSFLVQLVSTVYIAGIFVGAVTSGIVSDKFGRMKCIIGGTIGHVAFSVAGAFMNNYAGFVVMRFLTAVFNTSAYLAGFVVVMEVIGPRWRVETGTIYQIFFSVGFMLLPGMAYLVRDFRRLQVVMGIPPIIALVFIWLLPESPRWMLIKGRDEEAEKTFRHIAAVNQKPLPDTITFEQQETSEAGKGGLLDLFRTPNMRKRILAIYLIWFTCSLMYYGLSLNTAALSGNVFLNTFISGAVEIPANLICVVALNKIGRRWTIGAALIFGAIASFAQIPLIGRSNLSWLMTTFSMLGKAGITTAFSGIYVFTAELIPTEIRNVGVGSSSTVARISGMGSPFIGGPLRRVWGPLPSVIFGVLSALSGLSSFTLPETLNKRIPETIQEAEEFGKKKLEVEANGKTNLAFEADLKGEIRHRPVPQCDSTQM